jgi:hypothetical protein
VSTNSHLHIPTHNSLMIMATQKYLNEIMNYISHGKLLHLNTMWQHNVDIHIYRPHNMQLWLMLRQQCTLIQFQLMHNFHEKCDHGKHHVSTLHSSLCILWQLPMNYDPPRHCKLLAQWQTTTPHKRLLTCSNITARTSTLANNLKH